MLHGGPRGNYATEPEDHARFRARVRPRFSPRRMGELRPRVEALTAELVDRLAAGQPPADLAQALALPLPVAVICELPGVPLPDREMFRERPQSAADTRDRPGQGTACSACTDTAGGLSPASTSSQVMTSSPAGAQTRRCPTTRWPCWR
jgi:pentalenolactone synthase